VAAAPERRDAGLGDGRRQPEQHGAPALAVPRTTAVARSSSRRSPVSDDEIRATIRRDYREYGQTWCPHTATAAHVYRGCRSARRAERWVLVATAHPAKFNDIVEPLIGTRCRCRRRWRRCSLPSVQTSRTRPRRLRGSTGRGRSR
jgi:threonine synthase